MYSIFSTPLTCCSMGAATVSATTWALAPGYTANTSTVGGVISGYCATGKLKTARSPARVTIMDSTEAKIGRSIKNRENTVKPPNQRSEVGGQRSDETVFRLLNPDFCLLISDLRPLTSDL